MRAQPSGSDPARDHENARRLLGVGLRSPPMALAGCARLNCLLGMHSTVKPATKLKLLPAVGRLVPCQTNRLMADRLATISSSSDQPLPWSTIACSIPPSATVTFPCEALLGVRFQGKHFFREDRFHHYTIKNTEIWASPIFLASLTASWADS